MIPTGLNLAEFAAGDGAAFRREHGIEASRPVMLLVVRVAHEKNINFLLRVLAAVRASVPNVLLVIAGEGPALPELRSRVTAGGLGANTLFVGYLDRRGALLVHRQGLRAHLPARHDAELRQLHHVTGRGGFCASEHELDMITRWIVGEYYKPPGVPKKESAAE